MDLPEYFIPGDSDIKRQSQKKFWDTVYTEIVKENKYDKLCDILGELRDFTLVLVPSRKDLHTEFLEHVDVDLFKQQFEHNAFSHDDFIKLFSYWIDWTKKFGAPQDDKKMDELLVRITSEASSNGYLYILPYAYYVIYEQLDNIYIAAQAVRKKLADSKN